MTDDPKTPQAECPELTFDVSWSVLAYEGEEECWVEIEDPEEVFDEDTEY